MQNINEKEYDELALLIQKEVKQVQSSTGWECFTQGKVNGYKKKSETNSVTFMASTIVNLPLDKVVAFFKRDDCMQIMNDMVIQNKIIYEKKGKYKIFHLQMKIPFPMDNREMISLATWLDEGNKVYLGAKGCNFPIDPTPKFVMAHVNIGAWIFERIDANSTRVTNISDSDPRGNVPDFMKNMISQKRAEKLSELEGIIKKTGI